jgi:hypothetical protein
MDGRFLPTKHIIVLEVRLKLYFSRTEFMRLVMILIVTLVIVLGTNRSAFIMDLQFANPCIIIIQGDSVAGGPKLLSIKNYVIELMS